MFWLREQLDSRGFHLNRKELHFIGLNKLNCYHSLSHSITNTVITNGVWEPSGWMESALKDLSCKCKLNWVCTGYAVHYTSQWQHMSSCLITMAIIQNQWKEWLEASVRGQFMLSAWCGVQPTMLSHSMDTVKGHRLLTVATCILLIWVEGDTTIRCRFCQERGERECVFVSGTDKRVCIRVFERVHEYKCTSFRTIL